MWYRIKSWFQKFRCKLITSTSKFPNADLFSCLSNLRARGWAPRHVLDIGANQGKWSALCRRVFPDASYTLVEPQIEMKSRLDRFCQGHPESRWLQVGVSDECGRLPFVVYEDQVSSTFDFDPSRKIRDCEVREIEVTTVDALIESGQCPVPDLLKIDAEGFESRILDSAGLALDNAELVFLEAQLMGDQSDCSFLQLVQKMDRLGFSVYDFSWFGRRIQDQAIALSEIVFARKNGYLRRNQDINFADDYSRVRKRVA